MASGSRRKPKHPEKEGPAASSPLRPFAGPLLMGHAPSMSLAGAHPPLKVAIPSHPLGTSSQHLLPRLHSPSLYNVFSIAAQLLFFFFLLRKILFLDSTLPSGTAYIQLSSIPVLLFALFNFLKIVKYSTHVEKYMQFNSLSQMPLTTTHVKKTTLQYPGSPLSILSPRER